MTKTNQIQTPKAFYVKERLEYYSDPWFAFFRELFQNSVDAGATEIDITLSEVDGRGAFGREPTLPKVFRVGFADNGKGMDDHAMDVFFKLGGTTKGDGSTVGGFGRARIMLLFGQVAWTLRTGDRRIEGDGGEYISETVREAMDRLRSEISEAEQQNDYRKADALRQDLDKLSGNLGKIKGCQFEIDIDPVERHYKANLYNDLSVLREKLTDFMSMAQMPCKVRINGELCEDKLIKGKARRKLVSKIKIAENWKDIEFASVHVVDEDSKRAKHKGKVIVRANGVPMFVRSNSTANQVIVELNSDLPDVNTRLMLTANRDSLNSTHELNFERSLDAYLEELITDTKSALDEKEKANHISFAGELGPKKARPVADRIAYETRTTREEKTSFQAILEELPRAQYVERETYRKVGYGGIPANVMDNLLQRIQNNEKTFLADFPGDPEIVAQFIRNVAWHGTDALKDLDPKLSKFVVENLAIKMALADIKAAEDRMEALKDMHDIHVHVDDKDFSKDKAFYDFIHRSKPSTWISEKNKGKIRPMHALHAAWTVCVDHCIETLLKVRPQIAEKQGGAINYVTGWYFKRPQMEQTTDWWGQKERTGAVHTEREGKHLFLLNPIIPKVGGKADGAETFGYSLAYDLSKERRDSPHDPVLARQDLIRIAAHEVAHTVRSGHDQYFIQVYDAVMGLLDQAKMHKNMLAAVDAVNAAYGMGKTRVQTMDPDDGNEPRPSQVMLATAAPKLTATAGLVAAPENRAFPADALRITAAAALSTTPDGVVEVDCDHLQVAEKAVSAGLAAVHDATNSPDIDVELMGDQIDAAVDAILSGTEMSAPVETTPITTENTIPVIVSKVGDLNGLDLDAVDSAVKQVLKQDEIEDVDVDLDAVDSAVEQALKQDVAEDVDLDAVDNAVNDLLGASPEIANNAPSIIEESIEDDEFAGLGRMVA
jgi:hypothetical protein